MNENTAYSDTFSFTTINGWSVTITNGPVTAIILGDGVVYVGTGGTLQDLYCYRVTDGNQNWSYSQPLNSANITSIASEYIASAGKYAVYFGTANGRIYGLWDNGGSASNRWGTQPRNLGTSVGVGEMIPSTDGSYLYFPFNNGAYKLNGSDGTNAAGWPKAGINASNGAASIEDGTYVYFGGTGGVLSRYAPDGTGLNTCATLGAGSIDKPLGMWRNAVYVAQNGDNALDAVDASTMGQSWSSATLGAAATSGPYCFSATDKIFLGAGSVLKRVDGTGTVDAWSVTTAGSVNATPMVTSSGDKIFFGCNSNTVYGVDANGTALAGWPKTLTAGYTVTLSPTIDEANGIVIFGASNGTSGIVYAFVLQ